jgi:tetratricopeptide (TPR) repeat protein
MSAPDVSVPTPPRAWLPGLVLALAIVLVYAASLRGQFLWDDDDHVTKTQVLGQPGGLARIWFDLGATQQYYPLVHTSFWLEHELWGLDARGYRATNLVLHVLNALLLLGVLRRLGLPGSGAGARFDLAWLAAAAFALHPLEVETVAWISERKNLLSAFFVLLATHAFLRFDPLREDGAGPRPWRWLAAAGLAFACALFSKTVAATWPAAVLVLAWWKRGRIRRADVLPLVPLFVLAAGMGLVTVFMELDNVGAVGAEFDLSPAQRVLIAGRALGFYAAKLVAPVGLSFMYARWSVDPAVAWQWLFPLGALAVFAGLWLARARLGRGALAAVLLFAGTLFPALGFFDVYPFRYSFVADHFQYLAGIPLLVLLLAVARAACLRLGPWNPRARGALAAAVLLALATLTQRRAEVFTSALALWGNVVAEDPDSKIGNEHLGNALRDDGQFDAAYAQLTHAIGLNPDYADTYNDRGVLLLRLQRHLEALADFNRALELDPELAVAYFNRGNLLIALGDPLQGTADLVKVRQLARGEAGERAPPAR